MRLSILIVSQANNLRNYSCNEFVQSFLGVSDCNVDKKTTFYVNHVLKINFKIHLQSVLITPFTRNHYLKNGFLTISFFLSLSLSLLAVTT